jgi:hypothetical protein
MFYCMIERELFLMTVNDDLQPTDELLFPTIFFVETVINQIFNEM